MMQIRLSKIGSSDSAAAVSGGGAAAKSAAAAAAAGEAVTVACPDHLVIADLPVAKSLGAVTASAAAPRAVGRRSRRHLGERVHICSRCDFPVAIYGRLIPCEHAFCLACARSDSSCYLCEERIQKIQSVKMMEGIFICAAPLCLKSFLKRADFESHVPEAHGNLLQTNVEKEGRIELDAPNISRASMGDAQKQSQLPEISTARAPPRRGVSPTSSSHLQDREERSRHHQSRDQLHLKPPGQPKPPAFHGRQPYQAGDSQPENNPPQGFDRPYNWAQSPNVENAAGPPQLQPESERIHQDKQPGVPNSPFIYPPLPPQQPNFAMPMNINQPLVTNPPFNYPTLQQDGTPQFFGTPFQMQLPDTGLDQGSVLGVPPAASGVLNLPEGLQRPWGMGLMGMPYQPMPLGQVAAEGPANPGDPQGGGLAFLQPGFGTIPDSSFNPNMPGRDLQGGPADHGEGKGVLASLPNPMQMQMSLPPPPPPPQPPSSSQHPFNRT